MKTRLLYHMWLLDYEDGREYLIGMKREGNTDTLVPYTLCTADDAGIRPVDPDAIEQMEPPIIEALAQALHARGIRTQVADPAAERERYLRKQSSLLLTNFRNKAGEPTPRIVQEWLDLKNKESTKKE